MDTETLIREFHHVAKLAGVSLEASDIHVESLPAPHTPPTRLPVGKMAVYIFAYDNTVLKVGKAGPKCQARYTSQHYNPDSAPSTVAASLIKNQKFDVSEPVGDWMKKNTARTNFLLSVRCGIPVHAIRGIPAMQT